MRSNLPAPSLLHRKNSLFDVANVIHPGDERWYDGINFTPHGCEVIFGHDTKCWSPRGDKLIQECHPYAQFYPYVLEATLAWHTADLGAGPKEMLTHAFEYGASAVLARLSEAPIEAVADGDPIPPPMMAGAISDYGITGRASADVVNPKLEDAMMIGTNTSAVEAIARVEAKLIDASDHVGSGGTVWMSPVTAALGRDALCTEPGGRIYTVGTYSPVIIENLRGMDGARTVYGHVGEVDVYLGPVDVIEMTEVASNEYIVQAEQMAVAVWNTCAVFSQTVGTVTP